MPDTAIIGFFDGACEPRNPGGSIGIGAILYECPEPDLRSGSIRTGSGAKELFRYAECYHKGERNFTETSNNVAEYCACLILVDYLSKNKLQNRSIILCGDSMLVIAQMNGNWTMNGGIYLPYAKKLKALIPQFSNLTFKWISRNYNGVADNLSKFSMKKRGVQFKIQPDSDG